MSKSPYSYPHRSRKAQIEYLAGHDDYGGWNHPFRGWSPLAWNVKIGNVNWRNPKGEEQLDPDFDERWESYVNSNSELFGWICEDMARTYVEGEYTTYPGDDQGEWEFTFAGRSGGNMLLSRWKTKGVNVDFLKQFSGEDDWQEWLGEISTDTLRALYRAVRCMDQDFTHDKIDREFEYHLNFRRHEWESEIHAEQASY